METRSKYPKVSILLPSLNSRPYLDERMRSIREQTFTDWELIVLDSGSTDGSWEFFQEYAKEDSRIQIYQNSIRGIYFNLNGLVSIAKGEYYYFAMADDTMEPNALEELVNALEEHPKCGIAHCNLLIIDEDNQQSNQKLWDTFFIVRYFGDLIHQKHIRKAPHDSLLHFSGITVYTSLTQLLIRSAVFWLFGDFSLDFGSMADYEWVLRATSYISTVHVPKYLATWRIHSLQATSDNRLNLAKGEGLFIKMARYAIQKARVRFPDAFDEYNMDELFYILEKEHLYYKLNNCNTKFGKYLVALEYLYRNPFLLNEYRIAREEKRNFISQEDTLDYIKRIITRYDLEKNLILLPSS